jgi:hypothetical protein
MNKNYRARKLDERLQDEDESIDSLKISLPPRLYSFCAHWSRKGLLCMYLPSGTAKAMSTVYLVSMKSCNKPIAFLLVLTDTLIP